MKFVHCQYLIVFVGKNIWLIIADLLVEKGVKVLELPPGRRYISLVKKIFYLFILITFISMSSLIAIENISVEEFRDEYTQTFSRLKTIRNFHRTQTFISSNTQAYCVLPSFGCVFFSFVAQCLFITTRLRYIPLGINAPPI